MKKFANASEEDLDRWFVLCRKKHKPFVAVIPKRKYVDIQWDCMHLYKYIESIIPLCYEEIISSIKDILIDFNVGNHNIGHNPLLWHLRGIPIEDAPFVAIKLYDLFNENSKRYNKNIEI